MMPAASNKTEQKSSFEALDVHKAYANVLEKKLRNIEKRKSKLDAIKQKQDAGDSLEKEQKETLKHYDEVGAQLEFGRDIQKSMNALGAECEKMDKKRLKKEKQEKMANELKRSSDILQIQTTLDALGNDNVRDHFKTGKHGAVVLTDDNLNSLDELYKLIAAPVAGEENFNEKLATASDHLTSLVDGRDRAVAGSTYKELSELLQLIVSCGYFERAREAAAVEGKEEIKEEEVQEQAEEVPVASEVPASSTETFCEPPQPEVPAPSAPAPAPAPAPEIEEPSLPHPQQVLQSAVAPHEAPTSTFVAAMPMSTSPLFQAPPLEPPPQPSVPKSRPLSEIVSQVEGQFSFLQESEIDIDSPHAIDPAVVAAQPMLRPPSVPSQQPPQTNMMPAGFPAASPHVDQAGDGEAQDPLSLSQQSHQSSLDYSGASQSFAQAGLSHSQNLSSGVVADAMFQPPVEDTPTPPAQQQQHSSHMMGQALASNESVAQYELPPSIPLPPSQQDAAQLSGQEKKFQLNASATEFQSRTMYSQMPLNLQNMPNQPPPPQTMVTQPPSQPQSQPPHPSSSHPPESRAIPPQANVSADFSSAPNFAQAAGDYNQGGGNFQGGGYQRGGRGGGPGYRGGPRGGRGGTSNGNAMQNGFNGRPQNGNARPGNRGGQGGTSFQGFPPRNDYRPDGFQGYNSNGFGGGAPYQKRGGAGGPGYPRGGNNRGAAGMRGGVPRGGPPRGANSNRGGMSRPGNQ